MSSSPSWRSPWAAFVVLGCVQPVQVGGLAEGSSSVGPDAQVPDSEAARACEPVICQGQSRECGDCEDNDADGARDAVDPDCWGPCDDSEQWLGDTHSCPILDCYFEPNCGVGNDERCIELTPNGCDCFGCCQIPALGFAVSLRVASSDGGEDGASCDSSSLDDPERCQPCQPDLTCINPCDDCELCIGKPQLEPGCTLDGACAMPNCSPGQRACSECAGACDSGEVCVTGCCVPAP
jgi:hypothetical protein